MSDQNEQLPNDMDTETSIDSPSASTESTESPSNNTNFSKRSAKAKPASDKKSGGAIASLAILIAIIGCGGSIAWSFMQGQQQNKQLEAQTTLFEKKLTVQQANFDLKLKELQDQQQNVAGSYKQQEDNINSQLGANKKQINDFNTLITTIKASQQILTEQVSKVSVDSSQTWKLFESRQLLKQSFLRLRANDIDGAITLLEDIHTIIKELGNLSQSASRTIQTIETAVLRLQQTEQVDRAGIYSSLAALKGQISALQPKKPVFVKEAVTEQADTDTQSRWSQVSNMLSDYMRIDFNADSAMLPVLSTQSLTQLRMALNITIEKAQWAALHGEGKIYLAELDNCIHLVNNYFEKDTQAVKPILDKLNELKTKTINIKTPDLTVELEDIANYLDTQIGIRQQALAKKGGS